LIATRPEIPVAYTPEALAKIRKKYSGKLRV
jgi:hypothetical protein